MHIEIPNYTLIKPLGEGTMAVVWLAEHKRNGRKAAMKILRHGGQLSDEENERLFLQEGRVLASFNDRNIVTIYDNDKVGETAYLAMEYLPGGTLLDRMQRDPIAVGEALGLVVQVASALGAMHRQGIVHRDLKPSNIMLRDETTPVLTDFGAVRVAGGSTVYGKAGFIIGTREYMSPEQMLGGEIDGRTDLYALGVVFHELLTGQRPYRGTADEIATQHFYAPVPRLPDDLAALQPALEQLLAKKPVNRFAEAQHLIDHLRHCVLEEGALRRKIGFTSSAAWSTQLRALGFFLDTAAQREVRVAQAERRNGPPSLPAVNDRNNQTSVTEALPGAPPDATRSVTKRIQPVPGPVPAPSPASLKLSERFVLVAPGTLQDSRTGLLWTQADNGSDVDWHAACEYFSGTSWDLPTIDELMEIWQPQPLPGTSGFNRHVSALFHLSSFWFWSATPHGEHEAWVVHLGHGRRNSNGNDFSTNRRVLGVRRD